MIGFDWSGGYVPGDVLLSVNGAIIVALVWIARRLAQLGERIARLEAFHERDRWER